MFTTFISTDGTTFPKTHQDLSLSFLWSDLEEWAFALFKACFLYHVEFFFELHSITSAYLFHIILYMGLPNPLKLRVV